MEPWVTNYCKITECTRRPRGQIEAQVEHGTHGGTWSKRFVQGSDFRFRLRMSVQRSVSCQRMRTTPASPDLPLPCHSMVEGRRNIENRRPDWPMTPAEMKSARFFALNCRPEEEGRPGVGVVCGFFWVWGLGNGKWEMGNGTVI